MPARAHHHDGTPFRDLNHNGTMEPYEDPRLPVEDRVTDLLARMTLEDKAGLLCHGRMLAGDHGPLHSGAELIGERHINHFAMMQVPSPGEMARWNNHVQDLAAATRLGIPVTLSSDPRHGAVSNPATAHTGGGFSPGPEPIGLAATDDPALVEEFARAVSRELRAVGIRVALHPMADLATEPRWARISGTFGEDADRAGRMLAAYVRGMQGDSLTTGVACMTKHFPGHGPQAGGEDSHFARGRWQAFPGGNLEHHLRPFEAALDAGTAQMMTCYSIPRGSGLPEVGSSFSREAITGLLRGRLGFDGVVCTDFNVLTGMEIPGLGELPPRNWGVEHLSLTEQLLALLDAGVDQLGGETRPDLLVRAVRDGSVTEDRIDTSVRRVLRDKFRLGLFEDPYTDPEAAEALVGRPATRELGRRTQRRSLVQLTPRRDTLRQLPERPAVYVENVDPAVAARHGRVVDRPQDTDLAVVRLQAPYEQRESPLERHFHSGSLEFPADELRRLAELCATVPTAVDVFLDRPAVLTGLSDGAALLTGSFGVHDDLLLDIVFGRSAAQGVLPFDLPSSMKEVEASFEDVPFDTPNPLFRCGHRAADHD
ncbi:glycoside hydrolase family 3 protein [Streptomyces sp. NPDC087511]|uniref:glycoside hydrolase family 3 protein n=1 Tax=Streptomyces sp. NPDC087511 TaxID=3365792 RepID=UPI0037F810A9